MYQAEITPTVKTIGQKTKLLHLGALDTTQYQEVADLTVQVNQQPGLGNPKTGQIHQNQLATYQQVFQQFNERYTSGGLVFRFGSYRLMPQDNNTTDVYFGPSIIDTPNEVGDITLPLSKSDTKSTVANLAPFVMGLLEDNGYMEYLKTKGLLKLDSDFWVEIAMDFYRDRVGAVGFHKDSLDLTIFVGLMFNNANVINGPEFFYDTAPDPIHQQSVQDKLPAGVLTDISNFRDIMKSDKDIYRSEIEPAGWIIFTDETINHSSPTIESRAISGSEEKNTLIIELESILNTDKLEEVRKYLSDIRFGDNQKFYPENIMEIVNDPAKDMAIADVFVSKLKKANMSIVRINDCDPQNREMRQPIVNTGRESCTTNLKPRPSRVSPDNTVLQRHNSDSNLLSRVTSQPTSNAPRQFIRLWVQVAPKSAVTM